MALNEASSLKQNKNILLLPLLFLCLFFSFFFVSMLVFRRFNSHKNDHLFSVKFLYNDFIFANVTSTWGKTAFTLSGWGTKKKLIFVMQVWRKCDFSDLFV